VTIRTAAVLGAGIMGSSTALRLARAGVDVMLFDEAAVPFAGASRWNEGKVHLGFLYAADPTLRTARAVVDGGLDFKDQVEQLTGTSLDAATTVDDVYLVHRDSVVDASAVGAYFDEVAAMVAAAPGARRYLVDVSECRVRRVGARDLDELADPAVVMAGFRVPERSVDTNVVADAFVAALHAQSGLTPALGQHVVAVRPAGADATSSWFVHTAGGRHGPFDAVVNALWQGRPLVDESIGHRPDTAHQHRFRVSVFARTETVVETPCAVLSVGPFGDVKNYDGHNFYLSWYPLGLLARAESVAAPSVPLLHDDDRAHLARDVFAALTSRLPWVARIQRAAKDVRVEGGWVYSQGRGLLEDPKATVHQRDRLGITSVGTYYSVDTGKYSVAPTLADHLVRAMMGGS
jgi:glycine/D-amino acid oxidase-like deaminating enzyme